MPIINDSFILFAAGALNWVATGGNVQGRTVAAALRIINRNLPSGTTTTIAAAAEVLDVAKRGRSVADAIFAGTNVDSDNFPRAPIPIFPGCSACDPGPYSYLFIMRFKSQEPIQHGPGGVPQDPSGGAGRISGNNINVPIPFSSDRPLTPEEIDEILNRFRDEEQGGNDSIGLNWAKRQKTEFAGFVPLYAVIRG